jgi:hypothetical protein
VAPKRRKSSPAEHSELSTLDVTRLAELGSALREKYAAVKDEPIPERLQTLIETLRAKEADRKKPD